MIRRRRKKERREREVLHGVVVAVCIVVIAVVAVEVAGSVVVLVVVLVWLVCLRPCSSIQLVVSCSILVALSTPRSPPPEGPPSPADDGGSVAAGLAWGDTCDGDTVRPSSSAASEPRPHRRR